MHQEFDPRDLEPALPADKPARRRLVPAVIALVALGGFGGVVYYAYKQGQSQQAGGGTPVIRADAGPVKVKPDDPGGLQVPNQNSLLLNNPPGKPGATTVERLLPPPETPLPRPEPPAVGQLATPSPLPPAPTALPAPVAPPQTNVTSNPPVAPPPPGTTAVVPPRIITPGAAPPPAGAPRNPVTPQVATGGTPPPPPQPAPPAAPAATKPPAQVAAATPPPPPATAPAAPVTASGGNWKIQLASVTGEPAAAETAWAKIKTNHPELAQLTMTLRHVEVNGKGYNRVQAGGFPDFATADKLCDALKRKGQDCIVVGK